jgi:proteasome assembly chaperone (PAC2) family protein
VDYVLDAVDELGEQLDRGPEGLDVLVVVGDLQGQDETVLLLANFLLDDPVEVGVEVLGHLVGDDVGELVALRLLLGDPELVEQLIRHLDDPALLDEDVVGVLHLREILQVALQLLELPRLVAIVDQSL